MKPFPAPYPYPDWRERCGRCLYHHGDCICHLFPEIQGESTMEKRGVVQGEGEAPRDKRASDEKAGSDAVSKAAEVVATPTPQSRKPEPRK